jgi:hypothetical protein
LADIKGFEYSSVQNDALLMKNLDKFFNRRDLPWVNLIKAPRGVFQVEKNVESAKHL